MGTLQTVYVRSFGGTFSFHISLTVCLKLTLVVQSEEEIVPSSSHRLLASPQISGSPDPGLNFQTPNAGSSELVPSQLNDSRANRAELPIMERSSFRANLHRELLTVYEPLELWYLRSSVEKAHQLDEADLYNKPYISSSLDDTFFILKKVLQRLVATSSCSTHKRMCAEIKSIMEKDFGDILKKRMDNVWNGITSTAQSARQKEEAQARQSFIVSSFLCYDSFEHVSHEY